MTQKGSSQLNPCITPWRTTERGATKHNGESSAPSTIAKQEVWGNLWKLECPPKIKQFLWRLTHNSLPLRMNIRRKGIDTETRCPVCFRMDEDGGHCFFKCKFVRKCWQLMNLESIRLKLVDLKTAREVTDYILSMEENRKYETITLMWSWWDARNKANAGKKKKNSRKSGASSTKHGLGR